MITIIAYDVKEDLRREKFANLLKRVGMRVQYSVFECDLNKSELRELEFNSLP